MKNELKTRKMKCPRCLKQGEFKSVILGLYWQCPSCHYCVKVSKEEEDKILIEALTEALKKSFDDSGMPELADKINVENLYFNPKEELEEAF